MSMKKNSIGRVDCERSDGGGKRLMMKTAEDSDGTIHATMTVSTLVKHKKMRMILLTN